MITINYIYLPFYFIVCTIVLTLIKLGTLYLLGDRNKKDYLNVFWFSISINLPVISSYVAEEINIVYSETVFLYSLIIAFLLEGAMYYKWLEFKKINPYALSIIINLLGYFTIYFVLISIIGVSIIFPPYNYGIYMG